jgi:hypothetical protein
VTQCAVRRAALAAAIIVAAVPAASVPPARADGDPASDVLLYQNVYLPYGQLVPARLAENVQQVVANANGASLPLRVAVIAGQDDLGSVVAMFGRPRQYAPFLYRELAGGPASYRVHLPAAAKARQAASRSAARAALLVVMPNGYGVAGPVSPAVRRTVEGTAVNATDGLSLGQAAVDGVARLARATGRQISVPTNPLAEDTGSGSSPGSAKPSGSSSGGGPWALFAVAGGAVLLAALGLFTWRRRRSARPR